MMELELSVTAYVAPANNAAALPNLHAIAGAAGAAVVAAANNAALLLDHAAIEKAGYMRLRMPITEQFLLLASNHKSKMRSSGKTQPQQSRP